MEGSHYKMEELEPSESQIALDGARLSQQSTVRRQPARTIVES